MERDELRQRIITTYGSARTFSKAVGSSETMICLILAGKRNPRIDTVVKWCRALGIDIGELGRVFSPESV